MLGYLIYSSGRNSPFEIGYLLDYRYQPSLEIQLQDYQPLFSIEEQQLQSLRIFNDVMGSQLWLAWLDSRQHTSELLAGDKNRELLKIQTQKLEMALESSETGFWDYDFITDDLIWDDEMLICMEFQGEFHRGLRSIQWTASR